MKINTCKILALIITSSAVLFYGCSTKNSFYYKTGQLVETASCHEASWTECYKIAGKLCQDKGYDILEKSSNKVSGFFGSSDKKELVFICKTAPVVKENKNSNEKEVGASTNSSDNSNLIEK